MSYQPGDRYTAVAGADLTGKRYHIVKLNSAGEVVLASAATDAIIGVLDNEVKQGGVAEVVLANGQGTFRVKAAATGIARDCSAGLHPRLDSDGRGDTCGQCIVQLGDEADADRLGRGE